MRFWGLSLFKLNMVDWILFLIILVINNTWLLFNSQYYHMYYCWITVLIFIFILRDFLLKRVLNFSCLMSYQNICWGWNKMIIISKHLFFSYKISAKKIHLFNHSQPLESKTFSESHPFWIVIIYYKNGVCVCVCVLSKNIFNSFVPMPPTGLY